MLGLLRRALAADPNDHGALAWWCRLHAAAGGDDALEACLVEVAREPDAWRPQLRLGHLALERGEEAIALDCFRSAIARGRGRTEVLRGVAYALADLGRIDDLVELCRAPGEGAAGEDAAEALALRVAAADAAGSLAASCSARLPTSSAMWLTQPGVLPDGAAASPSPRSKKPHGPKPSPTRSPPSAKRSPRWAKPPPSKSPAASCACA